MTNVTTVRKTREKKTLKNGEKSNFKEVIKLRDEVSIELDNLLSTISQYTTCIYAMHLIFVSFEKHHIL